MLITSSLPRWAKPVAGAMALFLGVAACSVGSIMLSSTSHDVVTLSLPTGFLLGLLLTRSWRNWPGWLAVGACGVLAANMTLGGSLRGCVESGLTCGADVLIATILLLRAVGPSPDLAKPQVFRAFVILCGVAAPLMTGLPDAIYEALWQGRPLMNSAARIVADLAIGNLFGAPIVLSLVRGEVTATLGRRDWARRMALVAAAITVTVAVFVQTHVPLLFLIPPLLLATAIYAGFPGVAVLLPVVVAASLTCTVLGRGPFGLYQQASTAERIALDQMFLLVCMGLSYSVTYVVAAQGRTLALLNEERDTLDEAQKTLSNNEAGFRRLLSGVVNHAVYMLDAEGRVSSWNTGAEAIEGYSEQEIIGQDFAIFFTPEDRAAGKPAKLLDHVRANGRRELEALRVRKNGSRFLARVSLSVIHDDAGRVIGFAKVAQDLTDRQTEAAQRAIMIEAAPNGMLIVNEAGIITLANRSAGALLGYEDEELVGWPFDLLPTAQMTGHARDCAASADCDHQDKPSIHDVTTARRDGSVIAVEVLLNPVRTLQGRIVIVSLFDLTERTRLQAEREAQQARQHDEAQETQRQLEMLARHLGLARDRADEASQAKSRFLAGITHEIRTPLNGILGYAQILAEEGNLTGPQLQRVDAMLSAGRHLLGMINAVLDLSVIESDRFELQPTRAELLAVSNACLDVIRPHAEAKQLDLRTENLSAGPVALFIDATRLRQVIVNLLGNAVKFTSSGGVTLRLLACHSDRSRVRIEVVDTGPGLQVEQRNRLFREFERLASDDEEAVIEGAGLGLAITTRLVERLGGSMGYEDNPLGGSVFWVELPIGEVPPEVAAQGSVEAPHRAVRRRLLLVDDVEMNLEVTGTLLRLAGHDVTCVDNGVAAVQAVAAGDFDVVLMDVRMPGMNGLEATRLIRGLPAPRCNVPVVAMTAQAFADQIELCRQAGMDDHLSKPVEREVLLAAVARAASLTRTENPRMVPKAAFAQAVQVFDLAVFRETTGMMAQDQIDRHLRRLASMADALMVLLQAPSWHEARHEIAEAAHGLGGSAGMFGFKRLSHASRWFERAAKNDASDIADQAQELGLATKEAIDILQSLLDGTFASVRECLTG